jgi:hypothetical protein
METKKSNNGSDLIDADKFNDYSLISFAVFLTVSDSTFT